MVRPVPTFLSSYSWASNTGRGRSEYLHHHTFRLAVSCSKQDALGAASPSLTSFLLSIFIDRLWLEAASFRSIGCNTDGGTSFTSCFCFLRDSQYSESNYSYQSHCGHYGKYCQCCCRLHFRGICYENNVFMRLVELCCPCF